MQTFLPFKDFEKSAKCLDIKRLRCQIKEAHQLINGQWKYHSASRMWAKYPVALKLYFNSVLHEYKSRGFKHRFDYYNISPMFVIPSWDQTFLLSHMVNLLRKDFDHYSQYFVVPFPGEFPEGYYWPAACGEKSKHDSLQWLEFVRRNPRVFDCIEVHNP